VAERVADRHVALALARHEAEALGGKGLAPPYPSAGATTAPDAAAEVEANNGQVSEAHDADGTPLMDTCTACGGDGECVECGGTGRNGRFRACPACFGLATCPRCRGAGVIWRSESPRRPV
jgi:hypothetical protein